MRDEHLCALQFLWREPLIKLVEVGKKRPLAPGSAIAIDLNLPKTSCQFRWEVCFWVLGREARISVRRC